MSRRRQRFPFLAVDVGNSTLRAATFEHGRLQEDWRWSYAQAAPVWWRAWQECMAQLLQQSGPALRVDVASVAPRRRSSVLRGMERAGVENVHVVTHQDRWPFRIDVDTPESVGIDRLANVAGLMAWGLRDGIAVDLGTAITVDVLQGGVFRGGLISPGLTLQARVLHEQTAALPSVAVSAEPPHYGRSTESAIQAGVVHTTLLGTAAVVRRLVRQLGAATPVVLTGGWGSRLQPHLRGSRLDPHLLFRGLWFRAHVGR